MRPERLLIDLTPLLTPSGPRGIGRYIRELARGLSELPPDRLRGIEVLGLTQLGWTGDYTVTEDLASFDGAMPSPPTERDFYRWAYRQRLALWRAARRIGAAAVHVTDPHATPLGLRLNGIGKIVTCHDLVPTRFPDHYFGIGDGGAAIGKLIERRRYRSADLVVAISDATRDDVRTLLGVPEQRVARVYNAVDVERWSTMAAAPSEAPLRRLGVANRRYVLYVGGFDFRKNTAGMMAGLAHARASGVDVELVWAGHLETKHIAGIESAARDAGVSPAVRLVGLVSDQDLALLYSQAVAHLFVSRLEGFGLTVVEAMACGCPVLTTNRGALAEVAGDAALTVDPDDFAGIGAGIARLVGEPALRADLVSRGRLRAPRFSRAAHADAMAEVYLRFLAGRVAVPSD